MDCKILFIYPNIAKSKAFNNSLNKSPTISTHCPQPGRSGPHKTIQEPEKIYILIRMASNCVLTERLKKAKLILIANFFKRDMYN